MQQPIIAKIGFAQLIQETQRFINQHWLKVIGLCLTAAFGRFVQERGMGRISVEWFSVLEILVELSRAVLVLFVVGHGSARAGFRSIAAVFRMKKADWKQRWNQLKVNVSGNKIALSVNLVIFMIIGTVANVSIDLLVQLGLLDWLKSVGFLAASASSWPVILFLKNVSIIPFTLIFEVVLVLWLVGKNK
ncbi:MAG: hypothetical protein U0X91_13365 [Spirosomataceae bacterium]